MCLNMHGLLHMISQKQKKIHPRGKINMRRNSRKSFLCSTFYIKRACEKMRNHLALLFYRLCFFTAPRAVTCDNLHLRASAHLWHVSAFLCNREFLGISCYIKKVPDIVFTMPGRNCSWCHPISQISLPRKPTAPCLRHSHSCRLHS